MIIALFNLFCDVVYYAFYCMGVLHHILPLWAEAAAAASLTFYATRLRKPCSEDVNAVLGSQPRCVAHRGAALDAPENTIAAFQYSIDNGVDFVEFDVRSCADGLVVSHDGNLVRVAGEGAPDVTTSRVEALRKVDIAALHPNREKFPEAHVPTFDETLDFLLEHKTSMIIDVKGDDKIVVNGVLAAFASRPGLLSRAIVTVFNPLQLYRLRRADPRIIGAVSYRPYVFSHASYDAQCGPTQPRFVPGTAMYLLARAADAMFALTWRHLASWCRVSAVLLHKDIVNPSEVLYWRERGVQVMGWSVNRPIEKQYWRSVLQSSYLSSTLVGEQTAGKSR